MRTVTMITMTILAGFSAQAGERRKTTRPDVVVCGEWNTDMNLYQARRMAAQMFAEIGVTVQFLYNPRTCPADGIQIRVSSDTPHDLFPGALAYALPYEGIHIQVFYDRVRATVFGPQVPILLAHILVHEITHLLEGVSRHSDSGVMKAHWDGRDYNQMEKKPLGFAAEDIGLIRQALASRVAHTEAAGNSEMAWVTPQQMQ